MKKTIFQLFISFFLVLILSVNSFGADYRVENLRVEEKTYGDIVAIVVRGMVRNLTNSPMKGFVVVHYLNDNGDSVKTMNSFVNGNRPIPPRKAGSFEITIDKEDAFGCVRVEADFNKSF